MSAEAIFQANLNADKILIDMTHLPDPITHRFWLRVQNQSLIPLYFKLLMSMPNWTMESPTNGEIGEVSPASTVNIPVDISRPKPSSEVEDDGVLTLEAYTDDLYTDKIVERSINIKALIEDLENWTDVDITDFDDGTPQGWSLASGMSIANDLSIEAGGYSARLNEFTGSQAPNPRTAYIEKGITLPDRSKVRASWYLALRGRRTTSTAGFARIQNVSVKIDGSKVFDIPFTVVSFEPAYYDYRYAGWFKFTADLSAYRGQTVALRIEWEVEVYHASTFYVTSWLDRAVIAGSD